MEYKNADLQGINKAIGAKGSVLSVKYARTQERNPQDNGRYTSWNFDNMSGYIFEVIDGVAEKNGTYYFIKEDNFNISALYSFCC